MTRVCRRNACSRAATASLSIRYAKAQALLEDLLNAPNPQRWDLCSAHADELTVPVGWELVDTRSAGTQFGGDAYAGASGASRPNRYAELSARLPEVAARIAASSPLLADKPAGARTPES